MNTLIAIAVSLLAATVVTASPPPVKHQATFAERFGDWGKDGQIQSAACGPKWPSWKVVCTV